MRMGINLFTKPSTAHTRTFEKAPTIIATFLLAQEWLSDGASYWFYHCPSNNNFLGYSLLDNVLEMSPKNGRKSRTQQQSVKHWCIAYKLEACDFSYSIFKDGVHTMLWITLLFIITWLFIYTIYLEQFGADNERPYVVFAWFIFWADEIWYYSLSVVRLETEWAESRAGRPG